MKSLQMITPGEPDVVHFADSPMPDLPSGHVLIEVEFAGLNFTDVLARRGVPGYASRWPFAPGMEVAGTIAALPDGTTGFQLGDRVVSFTIDGGGLAQYVTADARLTTKIPDDLDAAVASTIPLTWATAVGLIRRSRPASGDNVLITSAAGGVGDALSALLLRSDVGHIVGGIGSLSKAHTLRPGVIAVERGPGFLSRAQGAIGDNSLSVVLDSIGGEVLTESLHAVAPGGSVITYGAAAGQQDAPTPSPAELRTRNLSVAGFSIINLTRARPALTLDLIAHVLALVRDGLVIPPPRIVDWDEAIQAHVEQSDGRAVGKTVVRVN